MVMRPSLMLDNLEIRTSDHGGPPRRFCPPVRPNFRRVFEWEDWGPQCTRWIPQATRYDIWEQHLVGGLLAVVSAVGPYESNKLDYTSPKTIRLYDFRPGVVARHTQNSPWGICTDASVIPMEDNFFLDVYSALPFHFVNSKELPHDVTGVLIDGSRLICRMVNATHYLQSQHIHIYFIREKDLTTNLWFYTFHHNRRSSTNRKAVRPSGFSLGSGAVTETK